MGRVFHPAAGLPTEERRLGILLAGHSGGAHWSAKPRAADFFDLKGLVEALLDRLGQAPLALGRDPVPAFLHPGQSAALLRGAEAVGYLGALRPGFRGERDDVFVAEWGLEPLLGQAREAVRFRALPRFPAVDRDLSIVSEGQEAAGVEALIRRAAGGLLVDVAVRDRYDRPPVPAGKVSLTVSLRYQHPERTLTGEEVQASVEGVVEALRAAGLEIRGE